MYIFPLGNWSGIPFDAGRHVPKWNCFKPTRHSFPWAGRWEVPNNDPRWEANIREKLLPLEFIPVPYSLDASPYQPPTHHIRLTIYILHVIDDWWSVDQWRIRCDLSSESVAYITVHNICHYLFVLFRILCIPSLDVNIILGLIINENYEL